MSGQVKGSRATRLECLKIAATVKCQMKDAKISTVELARQFYDFVNADDVREPDDGKPEDVLDRRLPAANYRSF